MLVFGICLPACIPCGFCAFNQIFMANVPNDYWCKVPELLDIPIENRKLLAIPKNMVRKNYVINQSCNRVFIYNMVHLIFIRLNNLTIFSAYLYLHIWYKLPI